MSNTLHFMKIPIFSRYFLLLAVYSLLFTAHWAVAQDIPPAPNPPRLVNDFSGMLNSSEREILEQKLRGYADSTSTQIAIVILKTTGDYPPGDYAFELGKRWGIGQKGKNNGILILWATDDRKVFIATGRGMEGSIPDAISKRIISNIITPNFKNQQWYQGLDEATTEIIKRANGEYKAEDDQEANDGGGSVFFIVLIIFIIIFIIIRRKGGGGGGRYKSGGSWFPPIIISSSGSSSGGWGSSGGSDFGGFGGGDFGGGGAGGSY